MALAPMKLCAAHGCGAIVRGKARCDKHKLKARPRGKSAAYQHLYQTRRWKEASRRWRMVNPCCEECRKNGTTRAAYCVDHIIPHRGNLELFWDRTNWQSLCRYHHCSKTARGE